MADVQIGKVTHYYDKIGVAVIDISKELSVGDTIKITGPDAEFTQQVSSIQMEHQSIPKATKGQAIGLKVDQAVKEHYVVLKVG